jgi:hypothetical protein
MKFSEDSCVVGRVWSVPAAAQTCFALRQIQQQFAEVDFWLLPRITERPEAPASRNEEAQRWSFVI